MKTINVGRVAVVHKGDYSASAVYGRLDEVRGIVNGVGGTYRSKVNGNIGRSLDNNSYWQLISRDGRDGDAPGGTSLTPGQIANINAIPNKVDKDGDKVLSDNNYSDDDKEKVDVLSLDGNGDKYLADDGTYKTINISGGTSLTPEQIADINTIPNKVDKDGDKVLSDNNYSDTDKSKVDKIVTSGVATKVLAQNGLYVNLPTQSTNGINGLDGVGISSIIKTNSVGKVDTYTITYSNLTTSTYEVTNGSDASGWNFMGAYDTYANMIASATTAEQNDAYHVLEEDIDGHTYIYIHNGTSFPDEFEGIIAEGGIVDQAFNSESTNAIANKEASKLANVLLSFLGTETVEGPEVFYAEVTNASKPAINGKSVNAATNAMLRLPNNTQTLSGIPAVFIYQSIPTRINAREKITRIEFNSARFGGTAPNANMNVIGIDALGNSTPLLGSEGTGNPSNITEFNSFDVTNFEYLSVAIHFDLEPNLRYIKFYKKEVVVGIGGGISDGVKKEIDNVDANITPQTDNVRITIEGQSVAVGHADIADLVADYPDFDWEAPMDRVYIFNAETQVYEKMIVGVNTFGILSTIGTYPVPVPAGQGTLTRFGSEVALGVAWMNYTTKGNLFINKNTRNGAAIAQFQKGTEFYTNKAGRLIQANNWLKERGIDVIDIGWVWLQGEGDRTNTSYLANLNTLVDSMKADGFIKDYTKMIITRIPTSGASYSTNVENAKAAFLAANDNAYSVPYSLPFQADNTHLSTTGHMNLGYRIADILIQLNTLNYPDKIITKPLWWFE